MHSGKVMVHISGILFSGTARKNKKTAMALAVKDT